MHDIGYLPQIVILFSAAVFVVAIFKKLNLSPVLGYLVAGAFIGQNGFEWVDSKDFNLIAEFGIVLLLFVIGLELTLERLIAMRWHVFGFGTLQLVLTTTIISLISISIGFPVEKSILIGGALALSSTAIVLRVMADSNTRNTQAGRLSLANLLLQDFAVVPLLVLVPLLAKSESSLFTTMSFAIGKAFIAMLVIFIVGRLLLRPIFNLIASAKSNELFIAATLLIVLGSSLATEHMDLSLAMGAFIAGLLLAETEYQHQVEESVLPFKDLLMGLFFMTVGMSIDLNTISQQIFLILGLSVALILGKGIIIIVLCKLFRFPWGSAIHAGLLMAQGSEFAFILFGIASQTDPQIITKETSQILLMVVTLTMAITPALAMLGRYINKKLDNQNGEPTKDKNNSTQFQDIDDLNQHVVIAGFGRSGTMVSYLLSAQNVNYIVIEDDSRKVKKGRKLGFPVYHGDLSKEETIEAVRMDRAKAIIIAIPNAVYTKKAIRAIHKKYPDLPIIVRAEDLSHGRSLEKLGATTIVPEKYESGLQMAGALLTTIGTSEYEISLLKNEFRNRNYERASEADHSVLNDEEEKEQIEDNS